ncbi:MAG: hypothetical protein MJ189_02050 [Coriobacteriales bacterium]|nr:hypothetical protein [Coriobacteriales bacterium]
MDNISFAIDFVSLNNDSASTDLAGSASTGDILPFILIAIISMLAIVIFCAYFKKSLALTANSGSVNTQLNTSTCIKPLLFIVCALICLTFAIVMLFQSAFASTNIESSSNIKAYVNEQTGEIAIDDGYLKNLRGGAFIA